jgi:hypothetical protein
MRGLAWLSTEEVKACFAPCVWVRDSLFGFALHCVALLCAIYVRLHLVLFLAGGPFLPTLSITRDFKRENFNFQRETLT